MRHSDKSDSASEECWPHRQSDDLARSCEARLHNTFGCVCRSWGIFCLPRDDQLQDGCISCHRLARIVAVHRHAAPAYHVFFRPRSVDCGLSEPPRRYCHEMGNGAVGPNRPGAGSRSSWRTRAKQNNGLAGLAKMRSAIATIFSLSNLLARGELAMWLSTVGGVCGKSKTPSTWRRRGTADPIRSAASVTVHTGCHRMCSLTTIAITSMTITTTTTAALHRTSISHHIPKTTTPPPITMAANHPNRVLRASSFAPAQSNHGAKIQISNTNLKPSRAASSPRAG